MLHCLEGKRIRLLTAGVVFRTNAWIQEKLPQTSSTSLCEHVYLLSDRYDLLISVAVRWHPWMSDCVRSWAPQSPVTGCWRADEAIRFSTFNMKWKGPVWSPLWTPHVCALHPPLIVSNYRCNGGLNPQSRFSMRGILGWFFFPFPCLRLPVDLKTVLLRLECRWHSDKQEEPCSSGEPEWVAFHISWAPLKCTQ